jgi:FkbM family methyltransferase
VSTLKLETQHLLRRMGIYYRLQASPLYDIYWSVADASLLQKIRSELSFYRGLLGGLRRDDLIFDIGANHGSKTDIFLRLGARVVAVEPDAVSKSILEEKFLRYRLRPKPVEIVQKAVSDSNRTETMWIDTPGSAMNTFSSKWVATLRADNTRFGHTMEFAQRQTVPTITLEDLFFTYGLPFFIKIDVEGHELMVLRGLRQAVPYISFEVNLPEFRQEGLECIELLERLASDGQFNYVIDCRQGLAQEQWLGAEKFSRMLCNCCQRSIEVIWKTI